MRILSRCTTDDILRHHDLKVDNNDPREDVERHSGNNRNRNRNHNRGTVRLVHVDMRSPTNFLWNIPGRNTGLECGASTVLGPCYMMNRRGMSVGGRDSALEGCGWRQESEPPHVCRPCPELWGDAVREKNLASGRPL